MEYIKDGIYAYWRTKNSPTFSVFFCFFLNVSLAIYLGSFKRNKEWHDRHAATCMHVSDPSVYFSWLHEMDSILQTASKHSLPTFTFESHKTLNSWLTWKLLSCCSALFSQAQDTLEGTEFRFPSGEAFLPHLCLSSVSHIKLTYFVYVTSLWHLNRE